MDSSKSLLEKILYKLLRKKRKIKMRFILVLYAFLTEIVIDFSGLG